MDGPDSFEIVQLIGKGDVGRVYLVRHRATGKPYAMKAMHKQEMIKRKKVKKTNMHVNLEKKINLELQID